MANHESSQSAAIPQLRKVCVDLLTHLIHHMDECAVYNRKHINSFYLKNGYTPPFPQYDTPAPIQEKAGKAAKGLRFVAATAGKIGAIAFGGADPAWVNFNTPGQEEPPTIDYSNDGPKLWATLNKMRDDALRREELRGRINAGITALIDRIEGDDKALMDCYQSLLRLSQQKIRHDMDFLRRLLLENGTEPGYTVEEVIREKMNHKFKLKKRIRNNLMVEEFRAFFPPEIRQCPKKRWFQFPWIKQG